MNLNSIRTKINIVFISSLILLFSGFFFYYSIDKNQRDNQVVSYHEKLSNYLFFNRSSEFETLDYFENLNFEVIVNPYNILTSGEYITNRIGFDTIIYNDVFYIYIKTPHFRTLFKDLSKYQRNYLAYLLFFVFFIVLVLIYIWLIKSLKPLQDLKENIIKFSNGDLSIDCSSIKKDEIAQVSNEFDKAVKKIDLLLKSRQLFLRTIMHELKTPIAKGRIVSELIDDEKQKQRVHNIFEKLDYLINDFAKIEQIVTQNFTLNLKSYSLEDILDRTIEMLMIVNYKEKIVIDFNSKEKVVVDIELFSLVFKNLIDNAFKYSIDKKVEIKKIDNKILFISKGEILSKPLESYFEPYHNSIENKTHGMGLGLYIVKRVLDFHKMEFDYEYVDGKNIFIINL